MSQCGDEVREAPLRKTQGLFGHCPNSNCTPPPSLKRALCGTLFPDRLEQMPFELQFSLHKCPKPSWQGFRPPQNQANAHLILANSSLKKCPKPSGQGSRPPPPLTGNAQMPRTWIWVGLPLLLSILLFLPSQNWPWIKIKMIAKMGSIWPTFKSVNLASIDENLRWGSLRLPEGKCSITQVREIFR